MTITFTENAQHRGFSIVELVVAAAIIVSVGTGAVAVWQQYLRLTQTSAQVSQAALLTEEAAEALEIIRDMGWSANITPLALGTPYYLYWNGTTYGTSTVPIALSGSYAAYVTLGAVNRDTNNNIIGSGGVTDPRTLTATITVVPASSTANTIAQSSLLLHDVYNN